MLLKVIALVEFILCVIASIVLYVLSGNIQNIPSVIWYILIGTVIGFITAVPLYTLGDISERVNYIYYDMWENLIKDKSATKALKNITKNTTDNETDGLDKVKIPYGVTCIDVNEFANSSELKRITIPSSVKTIKTGAFKNCDKLFDVTFNGSMAEWNEIEKEPDWNLNAKFVVVRCSDGYAPIL